MSTTAAGRYRSSAQLKDRIITILESHPYARDSDEILLWFYLQNYGPHPNNITASSLLWQQSQRKVPSLISIARHRRRIQRDRPELRGEMYEKRQAFARNIQEELGYPV